MSCDDIFAYFTFQNGKAFLSAIADRITTKKQDKFSPVCIAAPYPSKHVDAFLDEGHPALLRMFEGLGVRDGVLNVQFFVEDAVSVVATLIMAGRRGYILVFALPRCSQSTWLIDSVFCESAIGVGRVCFSSEEVIFE
jgi:hypothetical protein